MQPPSLEEHKNFQASMRQSQTSEVLSLLPRLHLSDPLANTPDSPAYYDSFKANSGDPTLNYLETGSTLLMMAAAGKGLMNGAKIAVAAATLENLVENGEKVTKGQLDSSDLARETAVDTMKDSARIGVAIGAGMAGKMVVGKVAAGIADGSAISTAIDGKVAAVPIAAKLAGSTLEGVANGLTTHALDDKDLKDGKSKDGKQAAGQIAVPMLVDAVLPRADGADERIARKIFGTFVKKAIKHEIAEAPNSSASGITSQSLAAQLDVQKLL